MSEGVVFDSGAGVGAGVVSGVVVFTVGVMSAGASTGCLFTKRKYAPNNTTTTKIIHQIVLLFIYYIHLLSYFHTNFIIQNLNKITIPFL